MVTADVAQVLMQETESVKRKAPARPYKARMATKVRWYVGDAMDLSVVAQDRLKKIWTWIDEARVAADAAGDTSLLALLGKIDHEFWGLERNVTEMERVLSKALAEAKPEVKTKYSEPGVP